METDHTHDCHNTGNHTSKGSNVKISKYTHTLSLQLWFCALERIELKKFAFNNRDTFIDLFIIVSNPATMNNLNLVTSSHTHKTAATNCK